MSFCCADEEGNLEYKTIAERCEARFIEKKSEFIGFLAPVSEEEEAVKFIAEIRAGNPKARHNCYAYILRENNIARHSDDGEPQGTAGAPIYEVLRKEGLTDVVCVVTRYFGGILLGAGGLTRAYAKAASDAVGAASIRLFAEAVLLETTLDYSLYGRLAAIYAEFGAKICSEEFSEQVRSSVYVRAEHAKALSERICDACCGKVSVVEKEKRRFDFA